MRSTKQKRLILEELKKHVDHPGADEIYTEVRKVLPNISLGTVYRNLENMSESGMILKIEQAGGQKRFDPNPEPHPHFRCLKCGAVEDIPIDIKVADLTEKNEWVKKRDIRGYNLEFFGMCEKCTTQETIN